MEVEEEEEFLSADDEDDFFDLPQDLGLESTGRPTIETPVAGAGFDSDLESANEATLPPGFGDSNPPGFAEPQREACTTQWNLRNDGNVEVLEPIMEKLKLTRDNVKLSKSLSYLLRHAAHKLDVDIRKDGFVRVKSIMNLKSFRPYTLEELMAVVFFDKKERYTMVREYDGELLVRANQGHTLKIVDDVMLLTKIEDPNEVVDVVHGSYLVHWPFIRTQGLSKVARNHIHLANGVPEDGKIRGMRSSAELFVYVDIKSAMASGIVFFRSKNDVILTQGDEGWLPTKFFVKAVRIDYAALEEVDMDYEVNHRPPWPAELAPTGPGTGGTYAVKNLESIIMKCKQRFNELSAEQTQLRDQELEDCNDEMENLHLELLSLEQRLRQHKGIGRLSKTERQDREKDNLEQETLIQRMDRAATPPWAKKPDNIEPKHGISQREKEDWAALGRMREDGKTVSPAEDKWSSLRRKDEPSSQLNIARREKDIDEDWNLVLPKKIRDRERERERERDEAKQAESRRESAFSTSQSSSAPTGSLRPTVTAKAASGVGATSWRDRLKERQKELQPSKSKQSVPSSDQDAADEGDAIGDGETETSLSEQPLSTHLPHAQPAQRDSPPVCPEPQDRLYVEPDRNCDVAPNMFPTPISPAEMTGEGQALGTATLHPTVRSDQQGGGHDAGGMPMAQFPETPMQQTPYQQQKGMLHVYLDDGRNIDSIAPSMADTMGMAGKGRMPAPPQQAMDTKMRAPGMQFDQRFGGVDDRGKLAPQIHQPQQQSSPVSSMRQQNASHFQPARGRNPNVADMDGTSGNQIATIPHQPVGTKVGSSQICMQFDQQFGGKDDRGCFQPQPVVCFWNGACFVDASGMPVGQMPYNQTPQQGLPMQCIQQQTVFPSQPNGARYGGMTPADPAGMPAMPQHPVNMKMGPQYNQQFGKDDRGKNFKGGAFENGKGKKMDMYTQNFQGSRKGKMDRGMKGQGKGKNVRSSASSEGPRGDDAWAAIGRIRQECSSSDTRNEPKNFE